MLCWTAPTCDCGGTPAAEFVYQINRLLLGNGPWVTLHEGPENCYVDPENPPIGMMFWYRAFARSAATGDYCCEEAL